MLIDPAPNLSEYNPGSVDFAFRLLNSKGVRAETQGIRVVFPRFSPSHRGPRQVFAVTHYRQEAVMPHRRER